MFKDNIPHQTLILDVNQTNSFETLEMKQGDRGSRYIDITLVADGVQLQFTSENKARFVSSNSGTLLQNDTFEFNDDSTITVEVNENALSLDGVLDCEVVVYDAGSNRLTSATFNIRVGKSSIGGKTVIVDALEKSVEEKHLDDNSVSSRTIAKGAVSKDKLDCTYIETIPQTIYNYSALDLLINNSEAGLGDVVYHLTFSESKFPDYDLVGDYGYYGIPDYKNKDNLTLFNYVTGEVFLYKKGTSAIERRKITDDEIASNAITGGKIADKSIEYRHIGEQAIFPEHLRYTYLRVEIIHFTGTSTYLVLNQMIDELKSPFETVYSIVCRGIGDVALIGAGRCVGRFISVSAETESVLSVTNLNTNKSYNIRFTSEKITEVVEVSDVEELIDSKLAVHDIGILNDYGQIQSLSLETSTAYLFHTGAIIASLIGYGPFVGVYVENDYNNDGSIDPDIGENRTIKCVDLSSGIRWIIDIDNETSAVDTSYLNIDQIYNPESENAQSGVAISGALQQFSSELKTELFYGEFYHIRKWALNEITFDEIRQVVDDYGAVVFTTRGTSITAEDDSILPAGEYLAFRSTRHPINCVCCLELTTGVIYVLQCIDLFGTGAEYAYQVKSPFMELQKSVGDIDVALDNIIAIQNSYIGGAEE